MPDIATPVRVQDVQEAHQSLAAAESHLRAQDFAQAQQVCEALISKYPDYVAALATLGAIHLESRSYAAAFPYLIRAAMLAPNHVLLLTNLARMYLGFGADELSKRTLNRALSLRPGWDYANRALSLRPGWGYTLYLLGSAERSQRRYKAAAEIFERVLAETTADGIHVGAKVRLGECCVRLGRYNQGESILRSCLAMRLQQDQRSTVLYLLSKLPKSESTEDILREIEREIEALGRHRAEDDEKIVRNLAFARSSVLIKLGRHEDAWAALIEANKPLASKFEAGRRLFAERQEMFATRAEEWMPPKSKPKNGVAKEPLSLFILAPSRAGKTSLETMLGKLEGVTAGGEHKIVIDTARKITQQADLLTVKWLAEVPDYLDGAISESYHSRLAGVAADAKVFTNTLPPLIMDVGRLVDCVPNSKFVFVKRNDDDVAFRIFAQLYQTDANIFAYNLGDIYTYISQYYRMADNWLRKLGSRAMSVAYEDMVEDPASTIEAVARFCGLSVPSGKTFEIFDDRGCAAPYRAQMAAARKS